MPKAEFDPEDPMELCGVGLLTPEDTTEAMAECFIEEFMRLDYDPAQILAPLPETRDALLGRIDRELARRGLPRPVMPAHAPQPTAGARLRAENAFAFGGFAAQDG